MGKAQIDEVILLLFMLAVLRYLCHEHPIDDHDNFITLPEDYNEHNGL